MALERLRGRARAPHPAPGPPARGHRRLRTDGRRDRGTCLGDRRRRQVGRGLRQPAHDRPRLRPGDPLRTLLQDPRGARAAGEARAEDRARRLDRIVHRSSRSLRGVGERQAGGSEEVCAAGCDRRLGGNRRQRTAKGGKRNCACRPSHCRPMPPVPPLFYGAVFGGRRSMMKNTLGRVKSKSPRRNTGRPVAGDAAGLPFVVYVKVVALETVTAKAPLYAASFAPLIVTMESVASPWGARVTTVAVVPVEVGGVIGLPLGGA